MQLLQESKVYNLQGLHRGLLAARSAA